VRTLFFFVSLFFIACKKNFLFVYLDNKKKGFRTCLFFFLYPSTHTHTHTCWHGFCSVIKFFTNALFFLLRYSKFNDQRPALAAESPGLSRHVNTCLGTGRTLPLRLRVACTPVVQSQVERFGAHRMKRMGFCLARH